MSKSVKTSLISWWSFIARLTNLSKGTGFIKFKKIEDADKLLAKYEAIASAYHQVTTPKELHA